MESAVSAVGCSEEGGLVLGGLGAKSTPAPTAGLHT